MYVREAHPTDGWRMKTNDKDGVAFAQPRSFAERVGVATTCAATLKMTIPLLVDDIDDRVGHTYSGMPDRLYLIDRAGRVAYKGGRGPFGFKPPELEQAINMLLLDEALTAPEPRLAVPSAAEAWAKLPEVEGNRGPLPVWARMLAGPLPRTTAAMLELDYLQRAKSPLDPKLRAKVRWAAARANNSPYGEAYALFDLRRAGATEDEVKALEGDWQTLPEPERAALRFARKLTRAAYSVTDEEFEELRKLHGDANAVGIVLCLAYANFQDRLLLALGLPVEDDGALPPSAVKFRKPYQGGVAPARVPPADPPADGPPARVTDPEWLQVGATSLRAAMERQKDRKPRIAVPTFDEVRAKLPPGTYPPGRTVKINWSLVCTGYQPELATAWVNCLRTFQAEAGQDRVFEECLFWVVTRSIDCFY